jgi:hypothetical protein
LPTEGERPTTEALVGQRQPRRPGFGMTQSIQAEVRLLMIEIGRRAERNFPRERQQDHGDRRDRCMPRRRRGD